MKAVRVTALMALASLLLSACAGAQATPVPNPGNTQIVANTQQPTQEPIAAIVNNQTISLVTLDREVNLRLDGIKSVGDPMPADQNAYRLKILDSLIGQLLIEQAASIQGIKVTDADVEAEFQAHLGLAGSKANLLAQIAADRMTEAEYRQGLRSALITEKMRNIVTASIGATSEQVHARHILVGTEATANEVLTKLKGGADFAQLAAQYSGDVTTKQTGGDIGWFSRGELLQKSVEDVAFSLTDNQVSQPVKSELGYHIVQTLERVKDRPIDPNTRYKLTEDAFERWIQSLRKSAHIEKFPNGRN